LVNKIQDDNNSMTHGGSSHARLKTRIRRAPQMTANQASRGLSED